MPPRRTAILLCAVLAPAAVAAGCGGKSDEDKVRDTLAQFETATQDRDFKELCKVLSEKLVQRVETTGLSCPQALERSTASRVLQPSITVQKIKIRDNVALAEVTTTAVGEPPSTDTIRLVKEGEDWRISSLSGAQPPAPSRDQAGKSD